MGKLTADRDRMQFEGVVTESTNGKFNVMINENHFALCTLSGKIRLNDIKIIVGDKVMIEVSPYETTKGRIVFRVK